MAHRTFADESGRDWEVWEVRPTYAGRTIHSGEIPPVLRDGWLAFRSGYERRRLTPIPLNWEALPPTEVRKLLAHADVMEGPGSTS